MVSQYTSTVTNETRARPDERWPGEELGLPRSGRGSLATWGKRVTALVVDWAACTILTWALVRTGVLGEVTFVGMITMALFFVEATCGTAFAGGSFGQVLARVRIVRLDGEPIGIWRAAVRTALVCLVLPALVIGVHRRGLHDLAMGTVVITR